MFRNLSPKTIAMVRLVARATNLNNKINALKARESTMSECSYLTAKQGFLNELEYLSSERDRLLKS